MQQTWQRMLLGYEQFREKYASSDKSVMSYLASNGQQPQIMIVACCDSRVDPALIMQCDPGDLFIVRNVANIVPPYELDEAHHGTSAALEFGIRHLKIKHLILLGHSQCGGITALAQSAHKPLGNDFIDKWVSLVEVEEAGLAIDDYAKRALQRSYQNCFTFPWISQSLKNKELEIHLWFFDIKNGQILTWHDRTREFLPLCSEKILKEF